MVAHGGWWFGFESRTGDGGLGQWFSERRLPGEWEPRKQDKVGDGAKQRFSSTGV